LFTALRCLDAEIEVVEDTIKQKQQELADCLKSDYVRDQRGW